MTDRMKTSRGKILELTKADLQAAKKSNEIVKRMNDYGCDAASNIGPLHDEARELEHASKNMRMQM